MFCIQICGGISVQGTFTTKEETHGEKNVLFYSAYHSCFNFQGVSSKSNASEVEIIRYQVLIPVTEVQVRASSAKDMDSHFLWELIHLRSQLQRRSEKVYVLSNRYFMLKTLWTRKSNQLILLVRQILETLSLKLLGKLLENP